MTTNVTGRDHHVIGKALAIAIDVISRAHATHSPDSDAADMVRLYLHMCPDETERACYRQSVHWLLSGGLDLRDRPPPILPLGDADPEPPTDDDGEPIPVLRLVA